MYAHGEKLTETCLKVNMFDAVINIMRFKSEIGNKKLQYGLIYVNTRNCAQATTLLEINLPLPLGTEMYYRITQLEDSALRHDWEKKMKKKL